MMMMEQKYLVAIQCLVPVMLPHEMGLVLVPDLMAVVAMLLWVVNLLPQH